MTFIQGEKWSPGGTAMGRSSSCSGLAQFLVLIDLPSKKVLAAHVGSNSIQSITFNTVSKGNSVFTPGCGNRDDPTCEGVSACNSEKDATLPGKQRDRVHPIPPHQVPLSDVSL